MSYDQLLGGLGELAARSPLFAGSSLELVVVVNPRAGNIARPALFQKALADLASAVAAIADRPKHQPDLPSRLLLTEEPRHAGRMAIALAETAAVHPDRHYLVVLACGDGTSLEFLDQLSRVDDAFRRRIVVLRLPMGTGNDGSDGRTIAQALARLAGAGRIASQPAIRVFPAAGGPASQRAQDGYWSAFNIASLGLDAFVTNKTNQLKARLPGNSYKLWVDIAAVFYDRVFPVGDMSIYADGDQVYTGQFLLCAMGVSGRRTYGANKRILPDEDNVCAIRQMPLGRKLRIKDPLTRGEHRLFPEALLFSSGRLELHYANRLLVQMDGEAELLLPEDFPLVMERSGDLIQYLAAAD